MIRSHRAEEGLPSSRRHLLAVPRPLPRRVPRRCASRLFASSMAFAQWDRARLPLYTFTRRQASLDAADRRVARPRGPLVIPLRRRPLNRRRGPATGLPGDYPDRTHTGWRRRTYGWTTSITSSRPNLLGTLPQLVEVRWRSPPETCLLVGVGRPSKDNLTRKGTTTNDEEEATRRPPRRP